MRFGISLPNNQGVASVRELATLAREAETLGFSSVWTSEHLFHSSYVEERLGEKAYHEALVVLTAAAMVTETVRVVTSVLVLPWHHPVRLAKTVASIDDASDGRFILGVGVAITEDEYANLGVAFTNRGRVTDEMLAAMRCLWEEEFPAFEGEYFRFSGQRCKPHPRQKPLPVYVGGSAAVAIPRANRFGQGWHPLSQSPNALKQAVAEHDASELIICPRMVIQFREEASPERPVGDRKTMRGTPDELRDMVRCFAEAGVSELVVDPGTGNLDRYRTVMQQVCDELMEA